MSTYGRGSITLERGKLRVRIPGGKGKPVTIGYFEPEDMDAAERAREIALKARAELPATPTLLQYGERYLARTAAQKNARSWRNTWQNHVSAAPFARSPLDAITTLDVDEWCAALVTQRKRRAIREGDSFRTVELEQPIGRQTAQHALGLLVRCLDAAKRDTLIADNPARGAKLPKVKTAKRKPKAADLVTYLDASEVEQLLTCDALPLEQRTVFTIAICQGLREGEIAALDWDCVDWDAHEWTIAASWDDDETKTGVVRTQTLLPRTEAALLAWQRYRGASAVGIMFPAHRGRGKAPSGSRARRYARGFDWGWADHPAANLSRLGWWRRTGLRTRVRFHDLRDTCATHLLSGSWGERWELLDVSRHIGHTSSKVTEQRYAHLTKEARRRAALALSTGPENLPQTGRRETTQVLALPDGIEPPTRGLGSIRSNPDSSTISATDADMRRVCGLFGDEIERLTLAGEPVPFGLLQSFAAAYLATRGNELAQEVRLGGPHALGRALELVALERAERVARRPAEARS